MIGRLRSKIERDGVRGLIGTMLHVIGDAIYSNREAYYMVCDLAGADATTAATRDLDTVVLDRNSRDALEACVDDKGLRDTIRKRVLAGHVAFLGFVDGKLATYSFATTQEEYETVVGIQVRPLPGEAYIYNSYTNPDYRGAGHYSVLLGDQLDHFRRAGFKRATAIVLPTNIPALKVFGRHNFLRCKRIRIVRVAGFVIREYITDLGDSRLPDGQRDALS